VNQTSGLQSELSRMLLINISHSGSSKPGLDFPYMYKVVFTTVRVVFMERGLGVE